VAITLDLTLQLQRFPCEFFSVFQHYNRMCALEMLINCLRGMKRKAHGAQEPRHIWKYVDVTSSAQRGDSPSQAINQRFPFCLRPLHRSNARLHQSRHQYRMFPIVRCVNRNGITTTCYPHKRGGRRYWICLEWKGRNCRENLSSAVGISPCIPIQAASLRAVLPERVYGGEKRSAPLRRWC